MDWIGPTGRESRVDHQSECRTIWSFLLSLAGIQPIQVVCRYLGIVWFQTLFFGKAFLFELHSFECQQHWQENHWGGLIIPSILGNF